MPLSQDATQDLPKTERVTLQVTVEEKRAYRFVGDAKGMTESDVARAYTTEQVMVEYGRIRELLRSNAA